jgi:hypothetical protein
MNVDATVTAVVTDLVTGNIVANEGEVAPSTPPPWVHVDGPIGGDWFESLEREPAAGLVLVQLTCVDRTLQLARALADSARVVMNAAGHSSVGPPESPTVAGSLWNVFETYRVEVVQ